MAQLAAPPRVDLDTEGLDRGVGFFGLFWASEGSLIGSGWLFGALAAATIAGPSAVIGWLVASVIVIVLALVHAELGGLFPVSGGTSRFPHYAFGSFAGATFGWASYLQAASVAPIEVLAAIQYLSTAHWAKGFYVAAVILMVTFVVLNLVGIRWLARVNNGLTGWKVFLPVLTIIIIRHPLPRRQLQQGRRLLRQGLCRQGHPDRDPGRRDRVRAARVRAGGPAGW